MNPECPYCGVVQDPPPQRKRKCRDCGQPIYIQGQGDRKTLITAKEHTRILGEAMKQHQRDVRSGLRLELRDMQKLDIKQVEVLTSGDERVCAGCRALEGKKFAVAEALESMPLPGDQCEMCRCVYLAVIDSSRPSKSGGSRKQAKPSTSVGCASMILIALIVVGLFLLPILI